MARSAKPLLGFGPLGWVALVVLLGVIALAVAGFDFVVALNRAVLALFGADALYWYVGAFYVGHWSSLWAPRFGLIGVLGAIIALRIHPGRFGWWRYALLIGWGVLNPIYSWRRVTAHALYSRLAGLEFEPFATCGLDIANGATELMTALVLLVVTRSWRVAAVVAGATVVVTSLTVAFSLGSGGPTTFTFSIGAPIELLSHFWHVTVAATLLAWAIHHRRHAPPDEACPRCGYDVRGATAGVCPECGALATEH